jgi:hypothetical protein
VIITFISSNRPEDEIRVQLRFRNIVDAINRTGFHLAHVIDFDSFIHNTPKAQKICSRSDILVVYRYLYGPILTAIQYWKAREKKVIVDFDQAIDCLTPDMPDYSFWLEGAPVSAASGKHLPESRIDPVPLEQFKWGLGVVDAATVVSARLASDWSQFTNIYEIPDYLNTCQYPVLNKTHEGEIWIGIGHNTHCTSFKKSGLAVALQHLCRKYPQVKLVLCGPGIEKDADLNINPDQILTYSSPFFDEWVSLLLKLDIGLAPVYSDFDLRLSPINMLEFMVVKIPWIATKQLAYDGLSRYGEWVQNSPEAWESAIVKVIQQLDLYQKKAGGEPFLYALGQDAGANIDKVLRIYSDIVNQ